MEIPPAGSRASKLADLGLPVVTLVPCEPDAFAEPLVALSEAVEEALSLLSSFLEVAVGWSEELGWSDDLGGAVLRGACEDEADSNALCK
jgi:hypothetical protein